MSNKLNNKTTVNKVKPIQTQIVDAEKKKRDKVFKECKFFISSNEYDTILDSDTTVHVVDAMMGKGKTAASIKFINEVSNEYHFIYITPFLTEVKRIKDSCIFKKFIEPSNSNKDGSKITDFKELLTKGKNIVTTHALFSSFNEEIIDIAKLNNYILIMDEVSDVVSPLNITKQDLKNILDKFAHIDNDTKQLIWDDSNYSGKFNEYRDMAKIGTIYVYNDIAFLWTFPVSIFKAFNKVFILTYKFSGQIQSFYYNYFKVNYDYIHIIEKENETEYDKKYQFEDKLYDIPQINNSINYKELLNIYCGKLNDIGEKVIYQSETERRTPLSSSWYDRDKDGIYCKILSNNTYNYFQHIINSKSQDNMWTTFQDYKPKIKAKGFSKGFVSCNSRATNDYADKNSLAYLVNRYLNPIVKNFFNNNGIKVDEEEYALSEMLQWIFRSRIRKGEQINIYIPSLRMRELLENWLEEITPIKEEV